MLARTRRCSAGAAHAPTGRRSASEARLGIEQACAVEIPFLAGRTDAQKCLLHRELAVRAARVGCAADNLAAGLVKNGAIDWPLGTGRAYVDQVLAAVRPLVGE
ncbi:MAG: hypothetical protein ACK515_14580 [bacterium]